MVSKVSPTLACSEELNAARASPKVTRFLITGFAVFGSRLFVAKVCEHRLSYTVLRNVSLKNRQEQEHTICIKRMPYGAAGALPVEFILGRGR
jgi:hypothetical protein